MLEGDNLTEMTARVQSTGERIPLRNRGKTVPYWFRPQISMRSRLWKTGSTYSMPSTLLQTTAPTAA